MLFVLRTDHVRPFACEAYVRERGSARSASELVCARTICCAQPFVVQIARVSLYVIQCVWHAVCVRGVRIDILELQSWRA